MDAYFFNELKSHPRITNAQRFSATPSRRGHLQSVLRDETLRHRLFRA